VISRGDPKLARAAQDLLAKIEASVPERLRPCIDDPAHRVVPAWDRTEEAMDLGMVRGAINGSRKILLDYRDVGGRASRRVIWPILPGDYETTRIICAWCEARKDFRSFRSDRVLSATVLDERFPERPSTLRVKRRKVMEAERKGRNAEVNGRTAEAGARAHTLK